LVSLKLLPTEVSGWFAMNLKSVPRFIVILGSIIAGLLVALCLGMIREYAPTC